MKRANRWMIAASLQVLAAGCATAGSSPAQPSPSLAPPSAPGLGAADISSSADPLSLLQDRDPVLAANKRLAFDMWRGIVNAGHVELADQMLAEDYIQHSPVLPTGRAAFKGIFSAVPRTDIPDVVSPPLITIIAEGSLVVMAMREEWPEPGAEGRYATTHFNLFRVRDGHLAEHWHSVQQAPGANVQRPDKGGPQRVTGVTGATQQALLRSTDPRLAANKRLVFDAWRRSEGTGSGAVGRQVADKLIEHDPTGPSGGPAFPPREAPLVAMVAQGDLVVLVTGLEHPHPIRTSETYTTTWFDMFRIEGNRLVEHWNGAIKPGTPLPKYGV